MVTHDRRRLIIQRASVYVRRASRSSKPLVTPFGNILLTSQSFEAWVTIYAAIQDSVGVQLPEEVRTIMPSLCGRSFLGYYEHYQTGS